MQTVVRARTAFHFSIHSFVKHSHERNVYPTANGFSLIYSRLYSLYYCNTLQNIDTKLILKFLDKWGNIIQLGFFLLFFCHTLKDTEWVTRSRKSQSNTIMVKRKKDKQTKNGPPEG